MVDPLLMTILVMLHEHYFMWARLLQKKSSPSRTLLYANQFTSFINAHPAPQDRGFSYFPQLTLIGNYYCLSTLAG